MEWSQVSQVACLPHVAKAWLMTAAGVKVIHLHKPPTVAEVTDQARVLCRDVVYHRLKNEDLLPASLEGRRSPAFNSDIASTIQSLTVELHKQYPKLYRNICKQLNLVLSSEHVMHNIFASLADAMFNGTYVSWGRIVALFLIASTLSVECLQQEHPELVQSVVDGFVEVTRSHLADWIVQHGGWCDIKRVFKTSRETSMLWLVTVISALVGWAVMTLVF